MKKFGMDMEIPQIPDGELVDLLQRNEYAAGIERLLSDLEKQAEERRTSNLSLQTADKRRADLIKMLGFPLTEDFSWHKIRVKTQSLGEDNGIIYTRYQLELMPDFWFYGILYELKDNRDESGKVYEKNALVLALHGGDGVPEMIGSLTLNSANYNHLVRRLIRPGVKVFAPQLLLWRNDWYGTPFDRHKTDTRLRMLGGSITALEVFCLRRTVDYFTGLENIDAEKIGVAGLSYGGMYTIFAAATDTRIKSAFSSCWFNDRYKYAWTGWTYLGQANLALDAETVLLVAPRRIVIEAGEEDAVFDSNSARAEYERLMRLARSADIADFCKFDVFKGVHEVSAKDENLQVFLKNLDVL